MHATATFFYEGRIAETGEVFDDGRTEGITVAFGRAQVMPPVERALADMEVGEERLVEVPAEEGFGLHDPESRPRRPLERRPQRREPSRGGPHRMAQPPRGKAASR